MKKRKGAKHKVSPNHYLSKIYYDPKEPASFSGVNKLSKTLKSLGKQVSLRDLKKWLNVQETHQMYWRPRRKFPRRKVLTSFKNDQWDIDLFDMIPYSKQNGGVKYLLTIIDIFSRYAYVKMLKTKTDSEVVNALKSVMLPSNMPERLRSDKGMEFHGPKLREFFHFATQNSEIKSNYVQRLNKTLKNKIIQVYVS